MNKIIFIIKYAIISLFAVSQISNRETSRVKILAIELNNMLSSLEDSCGRVNRGLAINPLLFLLYINNLPVFFLPKVSSRMHVLARLV